jgi:hypothetical protein
MAIACFKESGLGKFSEDGDLLPEAGEDSPRIRTNHDETIPPEPHARVQGRLRRLRVALAVLQREKTLAKSARNSIFPIHKLFHRASLDGTIGRPMKITRWKHRLPVSAAAVFGAGTSADF